MLVSVLYSIMLIVVNTCCVQIKSQKVFLSFCRPYISILMHFTGVKFLRNDLKGTGDEIWKFRPPIK